jgi:putative phage-type endonuclease
VTARLVLPGTAPEADWLAARRQGITASEIAIVLGLAPDSWPSAFALYHRKTGDLPEQADSGEMERGRVLEPYVCEKFMARYPEFTVLGDGRSLFASWERPWQLATPDRHVYEAVKPPSGDYPIAVLETKTDASPGGEWGEDGSDTIPVHYRAQVLWQMDVMGVTTGYVACLFVQPWKLRVYEITMDGTAEADLKIMRDTAQCFLDDIRDGNAPEVDWRPATADALKRLHPSVEDRDVVIAPRLRISYLAAERRYAAAKRRREEMANRMLAAIGGGHRGVNGYTGDAVATRSVYDSKRIDVGKLRENHPAAAAACTVTSTVSKLLPAKPKKEAAP